MLHALDLLERKTSASKNIPRVEPSLRWGQSPDNVFIEVKYATRFDSPACLDIFDQNITINEKLLSISAMCRNDQQLLKYELELELHGDVRPFELSESEQETYQSDLAEYEKLTEQYKSDLEEFEKWKSQKSTVSDNKEDDQEVKDGDEPQPIETEEDERTEPKEPIKPEDPKLSKFEI